MHRVGDSLDDLEAATETGELVRGNCAVADVSTRILAVGRTA